MEKIATSFLALAHNTSFSSGEYTKISRIDAFLVKKAPAGTVTITLRNPGTSGVTGLSSTHVFPAAMFQVGKVYYMSLEKIEYTNAGDQADPPFIGIL